MGFKAGNHWKPFTCEDREDETTGLMWHWSLGVYIYIVYIYSQFYLQFAQKVHIFAKLSRMHCYIM